ncbi:MAG: hypothetical protein ABJO09_01990 [Hyphomicrobiales bacterium]
MSGYKFHYSSILVLILAGLVFTFTAGGTDDALGDSEPRWVAMPDTPKALQRHFGMSALNCYALADEQAIAEDSGLENLIVSHMFDPNFEQLGEKRTVYSPVILAVVNGKPYSAFGQCHTEAGALNCGIQCDGGPFQLFDVDMDHIILSNGGFTAHDCDEENEAAQLNFSPAKFGAAFLLKRMDENACKLTLEN